MAPRTRMSNGPRGEKMLAIRRASPATRISELR